jgi:hypothetical protein
LELFVKLLDFSAREAELGVVEAKGFAWFRPVFLSLGLG